MNDQRTIIKTIFLVLPAVLALILLLSALAFPARAETGEHMGTCSLTLWLYDQEQEVCLQEGEVTLYQVAVCPNGTDPCTLTPAFALNWEPDWEDLPKAARQLAAWAAEAGLSGWEGIPDGEGRILFENLEAGVYLVVQTQETPGYEPIAPFLVSLPREQDGVLVQDLEAVPKVEASTPQDQDPTPTGTLPQTGQKVLPILLLAALGGVFLVLGVPLSRRRGRRNREDTPS